MAVTSAITTVAKELAHGVAEWVNSGTALLNDLRTFATAHTHTSGVDGALIPATGLTPASITSDYLTAAVRTHVTTTKFVAANTAGNTELPVFFAPATCAVSAAYLIPSANIVGNATDYNNLYLKQYTDGVLVGTLCTANSGTSGTILAYSAKNLGSVTGGTLYAGDVLTLAKSTAAGGTVIPDSQCAIMWRPVG